MSRQSCPNCGSDEHYVHTRKGANRFGITGTVVVAVECAGCGKKTKV